MKSFDCYFRDSSSTQLFIYKIVAESEEKMLSFLHENCKDVNDLAYCQTDLVNNDISGSSTLLLEDAISVDSKEEFKKILK